MVDLGTFCRSLLMMLLLVQGNAPISEAVPAPPPPPDGINVVVTLRINIPFKTEDCKNEIKTNFEQNLAIWWPGTTLCQFIKTRELDATMPEPDGMNAIMAEKKYNFERMVLGRGDNLKKCIEETFLNRFLTETAKNSDGLCSTPFVTAVQIDWSCPKATDMKLEDFTCRTNPECLEPGTYYQGTQSKEMDGTDCAAWDKLEHPGLSMVANTLDKVGSFCRQLNPEHSDDVVQPSCRKETVDPAVPGGVIKPCGVARCDCLGTTEIVNHAGLSLQYLQSGFSDTAVKESADCLTLCDQYPECLGGMWSMGRCVLTTASPFYGAPPPDDSKDADWEHDTLPTLTRYFAKRCKYTAFKTANDADLTYCRKTAAGLEYRGKQTVSKDGGLCMMWEDAELEANGFWNIPDEKTRGWKAAENYCRNPDRNIDTGPYCLIEQNGGGVTATSCNIPLCNTKSVIESPRLTMEVELKIHDSSLGVNCKAALDTQLKEMEKQYPLIFLDNSGVSEACFKRGVRQIYVDESDDGGSWTVAGGLPAGADNMYFSLVTRLVIVGEDLVETTTLDHCRDALQEAIKKIKFTDLIFPLTDPNTCNGQVTRINAEHYSIAFTSKYTCSPEYAYIPGAYYCELLELGAYERLKYGPLEVKAAAGIVYEDIMRAMDDGDPPQMLRGLAMSECATRYPARQQYAVMYDMVTRTCYFTRGTRFTPSLNPVFISFVPNREDTDANLPDTCTGKEPWQLDSLIKELTTQMLAGIMGTDLNKRAQLCWNLNAKNIARFDNIWATHHLTCYKATSMDYFAVANKTWIAAFLCDGEPGGSAMWSSVVQSLNTLAPCSTLNAKLFKIAETPFRKYEQDCKEMGGIVSELHETLDTLINKCPGGGVTPTLSSQLSESVIFLELLYRWADCPYDSKNPRSTPSHVSDCRDWAIVMLSDIKKKDTELIEEYSKAVIEYPYSIEDWGRLMQNKYKQFVSNCNIAYPASMRPLTTIWDNVKTARMQIETTDSQRCHASKCIENLLNSWVDNYLLLRDLGKMDCATILDLTREEVSEVCSTATPCKYKGDVYIKDEMANVTSEVLTGICEENTQEKPFDDETCPRAELTNCIRNQIQTFYRLVDTDFPPTDFVVMCHEHELIKRCIHRHAPKCSTTTYRSYLQLTIMLARLAKCPVKLTNIKLPQFSSRDQCNLVENEVKMPLVDLEVMDEPCGYIGRVEQDLFTDPAKSGCPMEALMAQQIFLREHYRTVIVKKCNCMILPLFIEKDAPFYSLIMGQRMALNQCHLRDRSRKGKKKAVDMAYKVCPEPAAARFEALFEGINAASDETFAYCQTKVAPTPLNPGKCNGLDECFNGVSFSTTTDVMERPVAEHFLNLDAMPALCDWLHGVKKCLLTAIAKADNAECTDVAAAGHMELITGLEQINKRVCKPDDPCQMLVYCWHTTVGILSEPKDQCPKFTESRLCTEKSLVECRKRSTEESVKLRERVEASMEKLAQNLTEENSKCSAKMGETCSGFENAKCFNKRLNNFIGYFTGAFPVDVSGGVSGGVQKFCELLPKTKPCYGSLDENEEAICNTQPAKEMDRLIREFGNIVCSPESTTSTGFDFCRAEDYGYVGYDDGIKDDWYNFRKAFVHLRAAMPLSPPASYMDDACRNWDNSLDKTIGRIALTDKCSKNTIEIQSARVFFLTLRAFFNSICAPHYQPRQSPDCHSNAETWEEIFLMMARALKGEEFGYLYLKEAAVFSRDSLQYCPSKDQYLAFGLQNIYFADDAHYSKLLKEVYSVPDDCWKGPAIDCIEEMEMALVKASYTGVYKPACSMDSAGMTCVVRETAPWCDDLELKIKRAKSAHLIILSQCQADPKESCAHVLDTCMLDKVVMGTEKVDCPKVKEALTCLDEQGKNCTDDEKTRLYNIQVTVRRQFSVLMECDLGEALPPNCDVEAGMKCVSAIEESKPISPLTETGCSILKLKLPCLTEEIKGCPESMKSEGVVRIRETDVRLTRMYAADCEKKKEKEKEEANPGPVGGGACKLDPATINLAEGDMGHVRAFFDEDPLKQCAGKADCYVDVTYLAETPADNGFKCSEDQKEPFVDVLFGGESGCSQNITHLNYNTGVRLQIAGVRYPFTAVNLTSSVSVYYHLHVAGKVAKSQSCGTVNVTTERRAGAHTCHYALLGDIGTFSGTYDQLSLNSDLTTDTVVMFTNPQKMYQVQLTRSHVVEWAKTLPTVCGVSVQCGHGSVTISKCARTHGDKGRTIAGVKAGGNTVDAVITAELPAEQMVVRAYHTEKGQLCRGFRVYHTEMQYRMVFPDGTTVMVYEDELLLSVTVDNVPNSAAVNVTGGFCGEVNADGKRPKKPTPAGTEAASLDSFIAAWRLENENDSLEFGHFASFGDVYKPVLPKHWCGCHNTSNICNITPNVQCPGSGSPEGLEMTDNLLKMAADNGTMTQLKFKPMEKPKEEPLTVETLTEEPPPKEPFRRKRATTPAEQCTGVFDTAVKDCAALLKEKDQFNIAEAKGKCTFILNQLTEDDRPTYVQMLTSYLASRCNRVIDTIPNDLSDSLRTVYIALRRDVCLFSCGESLGAGSCKPGDDPNPATCKCTGAYKGTYCQIDTTKPPDPLAVDLGEICDTVKHDCTKPTVLASNMHVDDVKCELSRVEFDATGAPSVVGEQPKLVEGERVEEFEETLVRCPLPEAGSHVIRLTNDGAAFSKPILYTAVNTLCYTCQHNANCTKMARSCMINGRCYGHGQMLHGDECMMCDHDKSAFRFSIYPTKSCLKKYGEGGGKEMVAIDLPGILMVSVTGVLLLIILVAFLVVYLCKQRKTNDTKQPRTGFNNTIEIEDAQA